VALVQCVFVRGEYEFVQFVPYGGGTVAAFNTFRLAAGYRF